MLKASCTDVAYLGAATSGSHSLLLRSDGESVAFGDNSWSANRSRGHYLDFVRGASIYICRRGLHQHCAHVLQSFDVAVGLPCTLANASEVIWRSRGDCATLWSTRNRNSVIHARPRRPARCCIGTTDHHCCQEPSPVVEPRAIAPC